MSDDAKPLEQILSDLRDEANVLRFHKDTRTADVIDGIVDRVKRAAEDYISFINESEAMLVSGRSVAWLRARFPEWREARNARTNERGQREYRMLVIPRRANISAAREAGRRGEKRSA